MTVDKLELYKQRIKNRVKDKRAIIYEKDKRNLRKKKELGII